MGNTHTNSGHTAIPSPNTRHSSSPIPAPSNLPSSVSVLQSPLGSTIYLVGVNHVSQTSCDDVKQVCFSFIFREK